MLFLRTSCAFQTLKYVLPIRLFHLLHLTIIVIPRLFWLLLIDKLLWFRHFSPYLRCQSNDFRPERHLILLSYSFTFWSIEDKKTRNWSFWSFDIFKIDFTRLLVCFLNRVSLTLFKVNLRLWIIWVLFVFIIFLINIR